MQPNKIWAVERARYQVEVCGDQWSLTMNTTQAGQSGVVGTRSAPPGLTEDIRSPQKGPFGAQTNPFCLFSRAGWFHMGYNSAE